MSARQNEFGQAIGKSLEGWQPRPVPPRDPMQGRFCRLEIIDPVKHGSDLFEAMRHDRVGRNWTYLGYGPFDEEAAYLDWLTAECLGDDPQFLAIIDQASGRATGVASYLRIEPTVGVIEVGHINFSPLLQQKPAATEAMFLMMQRVFDELGYRRYEWKCDTLNAPSKTAATRLGFTYEGLFRQATIYKGRNRDTAWYSIVDGEWPTIKAGFQAWLDPNNFDGEGKQVRRLQDCRTS